MQVALLGQLRYMYMYMYIMSSSIISLSPLF